MIMSQLVCVDECGRTFRNEHHQTNHTPKTIAAKVRLRKQLGGEFINGWHIVRRKHWTEYQRFYKI